MQVSRDGGLHVPKGRTALLSARRHRRPDPLGPSLSRRTSRPLGDPPVDHDEPDRTLGWIRRDVSALVARIRGHEDREIGLVMDTYLIDEGGSG